MFRLPALCAALALAACTAADPLLTDPPDVETPAEERVEEAIADVIDDNDPALERPPADRGGY